MKLWRKFKYRLLRWLLDDICLKSECKTCAMSRVARFVCGDTTEILVGSACHEGDIFDQARKAWGFGE